MTTRSASCSRSHGGMAARTSSSAARLDDAAALQSAVCYAGAYSEDINRASSDATHTYILSPPDMDEATSAVLTSSTSITAFGARGDDRAAARPGVRHRLRPTGCASLPGSSCGPRLERRLTWYARCIDPAFLALPARELADAALERAPRARLPSTPTSGSSGSATGAHAAARRPARLQRRRRGRRARRPGGARRRLGLRQRHRPHRRAAAASWPSRRWRPPGEPGAELGAGRAGRRAGVRRRHLDLGLRDQPVRRRRGRPDRPAGRAVRAAAGRRRGRPRRRAACMQVLENKFYADSAGTMHHPAAGPGASASSPRCTSTAPTARSPRCARSRRRPAAAGST